MSGSMDTLFVVLFAVLWVRHSHCCGLRWENGCWPDRKFFWHRLEKPFSLGVEAVNCLSCNPAHVSIVGDNPVSLRTYIMKPSSYKTLKPYERILSYKLCKALKVEKMLLAFWLVGNSSWLCSFFLTLGSYGFSADSDLLCMAFSSFLDRFLMFNWKSLASRQYSAKSGTSFVVW